MQWWSDLTWSVVIQWGVIILNFAGLIMSGYTTNRYFKMSAKLSVEKLDLMQMQASWHSEMDKWLANRRARIMARYERREAARYIAELNRLEEIAKPVSSKKNSPDRAVELPG